MTPHRALNYTLAAAMAAVLSLSYLLDGPTELQAAQATQLAKQDAIKNAATHASPARATAQNSHKTTVAQAHP